MFELCIKKFQNTYTDIANHFNRSDVHMNNVFVYLLLNISSIVLGGLLKDFFDIVIRDFFKE